MSEKRLSIRQDCSYPLQIKALTMDGTQFIRNSFSNNISEIGLGITSFDFFAVNEKVHLQVFSSAWANLLEIIGKVVWVKRLPFQERFKIGIEFVDTTESLKQRIKNIMNKSLTLNERNSHEGQNVSR
ncbi:MAG: PilZ domain-containing protein [Candidatus Omnitrophica bacterium]|nr:PilZ domain-containing protein [Candidatus Omnitrophota bacterium]